MVCDGGYITESVMCPDGTTCAGDPAFCVLDATPDPRCVTHSTDQGFCDTDTNTLYLCVEGYTVLEVPCRTGQACHFTSYDQQQSTCCSAFALDIAEQYGSIGVLDGVPEGEDL